MSIGARHLLWLPRHLLWLLEIGPVGDDIGTSTNDNVHMIGEDGVGQDIDPEDGGESFHAAADPFPAVFEVFAGNGIEPGQVGPSDASLDQMDNADRIGIKLFGTWNTGHSTSPFPTE